MHSCDIANYTCARKNCSGVYHVNLPVFDGPSYTDVYCNMTTDGGGWTVRNRIENIWQFCVRISKTWWSYVAFLLNVCSKYSHIVNSVQIYFVDYFAYPVSTNESHTLIILHVIARRMDSSVNTTREWEDYKFGFG